MKHRFSWRKCLVLLVTAALIVGTLPFLGMHPSAGSTYTAYEQQLLSAGFPESYVRILGALHTQHPTWSFEAYRTGLDWSAAVSAECSAGRSLVMSASNTIFKSNAAGCYDATTGAYTEVEKGYVTAGEFAVSYYMDPRNFLNEQYILQFEALNYHATGNELATVQNILNGTVLSGTKITYLTSTGQVNTIEKSYAQAILEAAQTYDVNPFYLASKIKNEVGSGSAAISGNYSGYAGLYNYYNIYAYGTNSISNALAWAGSGTTYGRPWTTPVKSIMGGAQYIHDGYIARGQTTSYFQRFNVCSAPFYSHQYMTSISGAAAEAYQSYAVLGADALNAERTFIIPVYDNMPSSGVKLAESITLQNYSNTGTATENVNLRTSPTTSVSNRSGRVLPAGTQVTILEETRSCGGDFLRYPYWYKVSYAVSGNSYTGYVCADYVSVNYAQTTLKVGETMQLAYQLSATDAGESPMVTSSHTGVATVNTDGLVTAVSRGTAYITARLRNGDRVTMCLTVLDAAVAVVPVTAVTLNSSSLSLNIGDAYQLIATVAPDNATSKDIVWTSDNTAVVTVGVDGKLMAVGGGTATVKASGASGVYANCSVAVSGAAAPDSETSGGIVDWNTSESEVKQDTEAIKEAVTAAEEQDAQDETIIAGEAPSSSGTSSSQGPSGEEPDAEQPESETVIESTPPAALSTVSFTVSIVAPDAETADGVSVLLKTEAGADAAAAVRIAEGKYFFENIRDGSYVIEVTDTYGSVYHEKVLLHDSVVSGKTEFVLEEQKKTDSTGPLIAVGAASLVLLVGIAVCLLNTRNRKHKKWYTKM